MAALVAFWDGLVAHVFTGTDFPQVIPAVVCSVSVDVVNLTTRPLPRHANDSQTVRVSRGIKEHDYFVFAVLLLATGFLASI